MLQRVKYQRQMMTGLLIILTGVFMTGCKTDADDLQTVKNQEKEVLTFMMPQSHYRDFLKCEIERFEEEYPQYEIEVQKIPDNQWIDVVKAKAAVCEMPDMIRIDKGLLEDVGTDKFLEFDASESWYGRVLEEQLENKKIDGRLYGMPVGSTSSVGLVCNLDLFEACGLQPPKTMEELRKVSEVFLAKGILPLYASDKDAWTARLGFCTAASQTMPEEIWAALKENRVKWSEIPEFEQMLTEFAALRLEGFTNRDYLQATYDSAVEHMAEGNTAMYLSGQFFINDVAKYNQDCHLIMVPGPYHGNILTVINGPGMFAVSKDSRHIEGARIFLEWFSQPENMDEFNGGWNHYPVFQDQQLILSDWQENLYENYIRTGKIQYELEEIFSGIDLSAFWGYQQDMIAGRMDAKEVLANWDILFAEQMKDKGMPGWD